MIILKFKIKKSFHELSILYPFRSAVHGHTEIRIYGHSGIYYEDAMLSGLYLTVSTRFRFLQA